MLRRPALARFRLLAGISLARGSGIEFLQWLLPLGRVVSPLDALSYPAGARARAVLDEGRGVDQRRLPSRVVAEEQTGKQRP